MKVHISFSPEEAPDAAAIYAAARRILPRARARKVFGKAPFGHLYLSSKPPGDAQKS